MTQRIFDVENEKDMADLWDILPEEIKKLYHESDCIDEKTASIERFIKINWHDKTEITRPIQEASEQNIGKLCYFWTGKDSTIGILKEIGDYSTLDNYCMEDGKGGIWFVHCRRLTKKEISELC